MDDICPSCGEALAPGAVFCIACGEMIDDAEATVVIARPKPISPTPLPPPNSPPTKAPPIAPTVAGSALPSPPAASTTAPTATASPKVRPTSSVTGAAPPQPPGTSAAPAASTSPSPFASSSGASRTYRPWLIATAVVVVLIAGITIGAALSGTDGDNQAASSSAGNQAESDDVGSASSASGSSDSDSSEDGTANDGIDTDEQQTPRTQPTSPPTTLDPERAARAEFHDQLVIGRERADEIADSWVPQLSSKKLGITDNTTGVTYDTWQSLIDDFEQNERRYGDVVLLSASDWSSFRDPTLYVTVVAETFSTPEGANAWCDDQGIAPNNCFAKYVSDSVPPGPDLQEYRG